MGDSDLVVRIRDVIGAGGFHGEGYRKVWARLRFAGVRTSRRRVLRLMREHGLLAFQRRGSGPHAVRAPMTARSSPNASTRCGAPT
jgi:hypothetical protein